MKTIEPASFEVRDRHSLLFTEYGGHLSDLGRYRYVTLKDSVAKK